MKKTSWLTLAAAFAAAAAISYGVLVLAQGMGSPTPPASWLTHAFMAVVTIFVFARGRAVRRMLAGKETSMTPLEAARVLTAAKTSAVVGSLLGGYFAASVLFVAGLPSAPARTELLVAAIAGILLGVAMVAVGLVVENWCRIDPPSNEVQGPSAPSVA